MLSDLIYDNLKKYKNKIVLTVSYLDGSRKTYTYNEILKEAVIRAYKLKDIGLVPGDRAIIISSNNEESIFAYMAITLLSCTCVLLDPILPINQIYKCIMETDNRCIITSQSILDKLKDSKIEIPVLNIDDELTAFKGYLDKIPKNHLKTIDVEEDINLILFTSEVEDDIKSVKYTHDNIENWMSNIIKGCDINSETRILILNHFYELYGYELIMTYLIYKPSSVCILENLTFEGIKKELKIFKPTKFSINNEILELFKNEIIMTINKKGNIYYKMFLGLIPKLIYIRDTFEIRLGKILFNKIFNIFGGKLDLLQVEGLTLSKDTFNLYYALGFYIVNSYEVTQ